MEFQQDCEDLYELHGIHVTGSHIVWDGAPVQVAHHPAAKRLAAGERRLFCLNTTSHRIPVQSQAGILQFADWEELEEKDLATWNAHVFTTLNPGATWNSQDAVLQGEAVFHPATMVELPQQRAIELGQLRPGMIVLNAEGQPTRVLGVVEVAASEVPATNGAMSAAVWRRTSPRGLWTQGSPTSGPAYCAWRSIITEHGTFLLHNGIAVRDYTDVGIDAIGETYEWVLEALGQPQQT